MIRAFILVYECDNCPKIFVAKTDEEQEEFADTWFDGLVYQFCPDCRQKPEAQQKLSAEVEAFEALKSANREGGILDAEFIN